MSTNLAILVFFSSENQPSVLGPFFVQKKHARRFAARVRMFFSLKENAGPQCLVRDDHPQCTVGFNKVDSLDVNFLETTLLSFGCKPRENSNCESESENAGIDCQKALTAQKLH